MRRVCFWVAMLLVLGCGGAVLWPPRSGMLQAQQSGDNLAAPFTVRITFGAKDAAPTDWDGSVEIENGRIDAVNGWRTSNRDAVGRGGWKLRTQRWVVPEGTPAAPRPVVASGVTVYGAGADVRTRLRVATARGNFDFLLAELRAAHHLTRLDGAAEILLLPSSSRLTADASEDDFPSVAEARDGTAWAVWASFNGKLDEIRLRRYQKGAWATFTDVPGVEGDVWKPQVAVDGRGRPWIVWSEQIAGNWDLYARSLEGETWGPRVRLTDDHGQDINPHLVGDSAGDLHVVWQGYRGGDFNIYIRSFRGNEWGVPSAVTEARGNDWEPAVASDGHGRLAVVWDSYRNGDYDVFLRNFEKGSWGPEVKIGRAHV